MPAADSPMVSDQLAIALVNSETKKAILYKAQKNTLTLAFTNGGAQSIAFPDGGRLRLLFGALLTAAEAAAITASAGWTAKGARAGSGSAIDLAPAPDTRLGPGEKITISLNIPSVGGAVPAGTVTVAFTGLSGIEEGEAYKRFSVLAPPAGAPASPLVCGWMANFPPVVWVSKPDALLPGSIGLVISNHGTAPLVAPGKSGTGAAFHLDFSTIPRPDEHNATPNPGRDALTYDDLAADIAVRVVGNQIDQWQLDPAPGTKNQSLIWTLKPLSAEILGPGASVELLIENVRTTLPAFTTSLFVQYAGIPGYDDGIFTLHLQKSLPQPGILGFYAAAANIGPGDPARLTWTTFAVPTAELSYEEHSATVVLSSDNGKIPLNAPGFALMPARTTTYTLTAYDEDGQPGPQRQVTVTVNELSIAMDIHPLSVGRNNTALLSWSVTGSDSATCQLDPGLVQLPLSGKDRPLKVDATTTYTITATNSKAIPPQVSASRTVTLMPVKIVRFDSSVTQAVDAGTPVTLSWEISFPSTIAIEPTAALDPAINVKPLAPIDSRVVRPMNTTTYTLSAEGVDGPVHQPVTVQVNSVTVDLDITPKTVQKPGSPFTLTWSTARATAVTLDGQPVEASGSKTVNPQRDTTYTLTAQGPNGPATRQLTAVTSCVKITKIQYAGRHNASAFIWWVENATLVGLYDLTGRCFYTTAGSGSVSKQVMAGLPFGRVTVKADGPAGPVSRAVPMGENIER